MCKLGIPNENAAKKMSVAQIISTENILILWISRTCLEVILVANYILNLPW